MSKYKHLLFDIDGTLIDTFFANMDALVELLDRYQPNHGKTMQDLVFTFGLPGRDGLRLLGFKEDDIPKAIDEWVELVKVRSHHCKIFDGILPLLAFLKQQGYHMGIITSRSRSEDLGGPLGGFLPEAFTQYITRVVTSSDTKRPKPFPDPILHYMEQTGAKREEVLFIGDAASDLKAADAAGVDFGLALWGYKGKEFLRCAHYLRNPWDIAAVCSRQELNATDLTKQLHRWASEINAIGQIGLAYVQDRFDKERYERLQSLACEMASTYVDASLEQIRQTWVTEPFYKTPQVDTRAAIFDEQGRILMVKEKLSGKWNLPGGWCDADLTIVKNTVKEVKEEACLDVYVTKLVGIFDRVKHNEPNALNNCLKVFLECKLGPGQFEDNVETSACKFFSKEELPLDNLRTSTCSKEQIFTCFAAHESESWQPVLE